MVPGMENPVRAAEMTLGTGDLDLVAHRFGLHGARPLGGFENVVLRGTGHPGRIVRLTHRSRRSIELVEAEVAFMMHLAAAGVGVVTPVPSADDNLVEAFTLTDGSPVVAYCMTEAPGRTKMPHEWSDSEIVELGDLLGRAHAAASSFEPGTAVRRPSWTDPIFDPGTWLLDDPDFLEVWHETRARAASHPAGKSDLLIHQDAHFWNLHIDDEAGLTVFDFDDCGYGTPEHDVAIVLFYWMFVGWPDHVAATRRFLDRLLEGYHRHGELIDDWPEGVDRMLKVRECDIYLLMELEDDADGIARRWKKDRRRRVIEHVPLLGAPLIDLV